MSFNHFDQKGQAIMVNVSGKQPTMRTATAQARMFFCWTRLATR